MLTINWHPSLQGLFKRGPAALCRDSQILSPIDNQTLRAAHPPQIAQQDQHLQQRAHDLAALNLNCKRLWKLCGALSRALPHRVPSFLDFDLA